MTKSYIKEERERLMADKLELEKKLGNIEYKLTRLDNMEKPYVACVQSYSGGGNMSFKTYEKALAKMEEYKGKVMFRNGLNYGVYLYKHNIDGGREMLVEIPLNGYYKTPSWNE